MNSQETFQPDYVALFPAVEQNLSMARTTKRKPQKTVRLRPINFLKQLRVERGLTQEDLAEAAGMAVSNVSQFEQRRQGHSAEGLAALARVLGCTPGQIIDGPSPDQTILTLLKNATDEDRRKIIQIAKTILGTGE